MPEPKSLSGAGSRSAPLRHDVLILIVGAALLAGGIAAGWYLRPRRAAGSALDCDSREQCATFCDRKEWVGCTRLAAQYWFPKAGRRDLGRAESLYREACEAGEPLGCFSLGRMYQDALALRDKNAEAPELLRRAAEGFERGCNEGNARSCADLAAMHVAGRGVDRNPERAAALHSKAAPILEGECTAGQAHSCSLLAQLAWGAAGVPRDLNRSMTLTERACELGDRRSCMRAGTELINGRQDMGKDHARASKMFEKACDLGEMAGCHSLARLVHDGSGVPLDWKQSAALEKKACEGGYAPACRELGRMAGAGEGMKKDAGRQDELYKREVSLRASACAEGSAEDCDELGRNYRNLGLGVTVDFQRAREFEEQALRWLQENCDAGSLGDCSGLRMRLQGRPALADRMRGIRERECQLGAADQCRILSRER